jgi:MurNAc alpha-1-phosphate uridylyltransferase
MSIKVKTAMVLAAGRGERLRPLTDRIPKPLVPLGGRSLLDHAIDRLETAGVERVIVNVHYLGEQIVARLSHRHSPEIVIVREPSLLETGGAIVNALALLGDEPFYAVNADSYWLDGTVSALGRLAVAFDPATTDAVLLLQRTVSAVGYDREDGDFMLDPLGVPTRRAESEIAPYLFAGIQLLSPQLFRDPPAPPFSLNRIYDAALAAGRLRGVVHDGEWYHVSTPEGLALVEARLELRRTEH